MSNLEVFILSLIEGLTEFLPVSSTGHLIIASSLMKLQPTDFSKAFDVIIQFGAILAVVVLYWRHLKWNFIFYRNIALAFIPTAILGLIFKSKVDLLMESNTVVAVSLIVGGVLLIFIDELFKHRPHKDLTPKASVMIGLAQSVAMVPGVSRSAATIIGARYFGLTREKAAEFSFILAIPTLGAATFYKLWKIRDLIHGDNMMQLSLGTFLSFVFALWAIKFFITVVNRYGFKFFGYYRVAIGVAVLALQFMGII